MGAFAGYGLKAYLVCQSLNHVTRAYGRDSVIVDNCHVITSFAAADLETAKTIAAMAGERWEVIESHSVNRPRAIIAPRGSASFREERRPLLLPGDVRQLPADQQIIFVAGAKPILTQKLKFDREPVFQRRLRAAQVTSAQLTTSHDWIGVRALGQRDKAAKGSMKAPPALAGQRSGQGDLFPELKISEQASAGLRAKARDPDVRGTGI